MDYRIEKLLTKIHSDCMQASNIEQMAESVNVSVFHLQHLFKQETGTSIAKYVKELRFQKARELIETTNLSIKEIRVKAGLTGKNHFFRDFRQKFGSTPTEYRKNFRS